MTVLKFRVWDTKNLEWNTSLPQLDDQFLSKSRAKGLWIPGDCIFQIFSGLIDKKGTEICEGDILLYVPDYLESQGGQGGQVENTVGKVTYDSGCFDWNGEPLWENNRHVEVIGNIFDNPELL